MPNNQISFVVPRDDVAIIRSHAEEIARRWRGYTVSVKDVKSAYHWYCYQKEKPPTPQA